MKFSIDPENQFRTNNGLPSPDSISSKKPKASEWNPENQLKKATAPVATPEKTQLFFFKALTTSRGIPSVLETCRPKCDLKINDPRVAGDLCLRFVALFTIYFCSCFKEFLGGALLSRIFWPSFPKHFKSYIQHCNKT